MDRWRALIDLMGQPVPCARCGTELPAAELTETTEPRGVVGYGLDDEGGPHFVVTEVIWVCSGCQGGAGG